MSLSILYFVILIYIPWSNAEPGVGPYRMRMLNYTQCQGLKSHRHVSWNGTLVHYSNNSDRFTVTLKADKHIGPLSISVKLYTWKDNAFKMLFKLNENDPCALLNILAIRESGEHVYYCPDFDVLMHRRRDSTFYGKFMYAVQLFTKVDQVYCAKFICLIEKI